VTDSKKKILHDEQTSAAAESLRAAVRDVRGGMTQADTEKFLQKIEGIAKSLDEQGKSEEEITALREERGEVDPMKTTAELVKETFEKDQKEGAAERSISSPGIPGGDTREDLGKPRIPSAQSATTREAIEKTAKEADDKIKAAAKK
jgi:type II secretory pathway component GspD/PulD (secretin)